MVGWKFYPERLAAEMAARHLNDVAMAYRCHCRVEYIHHWLDGSKVPTQASMAKIGMALGMDDPVSVLCEPHR